MNADFEILPLYESAIAVLLKVKEPGCALDVGKRLRVLLLEEFEPFAAHGAELQIPDKLLVMKLADPQEIEYIFVEVI